VAVPEESPFRTSLDDRRAMLANHFLQAIEPMLEETPYADLNVERITKAAKVSRTSFYQYFQDKMDLLLEMTDRVTSDLVGVGVWQLPDQGTKDELRETLGRLIELYRGHRLLLRAVVEGAGYDTSLRAAYDAVVATGIQAFQDHIATGQEHATIAPGLSPHGTARVLVYMIERSLYQVIGVDGESADEELLDPLTDAIWRTLYEGYR
jgi:AcrR family transcriptional regulator